MLLWCDRSTSPADWGQRVNGSLRAAAPFAKSDELSSIQWSKAQQAEREQSGECSRRSVVTAVEQPITDPHQRPARNIEGLGPVGNPLWQSSTWCRTHTQEGRRDSGNKLLFTLPYLLFILLQNFTQTIANLQTSVEQRGTKQQKQNKKYLSSKRHK